MLYGCGFGLIIILGEPWINEIVGCDYRGRLIAIYTATYTLFQTIGPSSMASFGTDNSNLLYVSAMVYIIAGALLCFAQPLFLFDKKKIENNKSKLRIFKKIIKETDIYVGIFFFALFDISILALLPTYSISYGHSEQVALAMVTVVFAGDAVCQYWVGYLADKKGIMIIYIICGVITFLTTLLLGYAIDSSIILWPLLFILGAVAGGIYTLALTLIGDRYKGGELVTANAGVAIITGLGSIIGPLLGGFMMDLSTSGLIYMLLIFSSCFILITITTYTNNIKK